MPKPLFTERVGNLLETWEYDLGSDTVLVRREQDAQGIVDHVAARNLEGVASIDGLGQPQCEVPIAVAIDFCQARGIPWEKFLYTNEYDDQWGRFLREHPNLAYRPAKKYHAVSV
jgi:hypothetical protein